MLVFLALVTGMGISQQHVFGQMTRQEKSQLELLESEITKLENSINQDVKAFEKSKREAQFELGRELGRLEIQADPKRAASVDEIEWLKKEMERVRLQIDSVESSTPYSFELEYKKEKLFLLQEQREEMIQRFLSPNLAIPREMGRLTKNRRQRANVIRREELGLMRSENNIRSLDTAVDQTIAPKGFKIIFDNKYSLNTTFRLIPLDGGERLAINLAPRTKQYVDVLSGRYLVEFIVNGRKWDELTSPLTIDGTKHSYEKEECFGFVYKSEF